MDQLQARVFARNCSDHIVDNTIGLQQRDPRGGPDQKRCPEWQKHEDQNQVALPLVQMGNVVGQRITQQEAESCNTRCHDQGSREQRKVDLFLLGLGHPAAVRLANLIKRRYVITRCRASAGVPQSAPDLRVAPAQVNLIECLRIGRVEAMGLTRSLDQQRAHARTFEIHARRNLADLAGSVGAREIISKGGIGTERRAAFPIPRSQCCSGAWQDI